MKLKLFFVTLFLLIPRLACAIPVGLVWDVRPDVDGYKLYFGEASGQYDGQTIDGLNSPITIPIESLSDPNPGYPIYTIKVEMGRTWFYALTAYKDELGESSKTPEINRAHLKLSNSTLMCMEVQNTKQ
jgi:hypothetical protein